MTFLRPEDDELFILVKEFKEYRPWKTRQQFDKEIGKYVGPKETARLWRYFVIQ